MSSERRASERRMLSRRHAGGMRQSLTREECASRGRNAPVPPDRGLLTAWLSASACLLVACLTASGPRTAPAASLVCLPLVRVLVVSISLSALGASLGASHGASHGAIHCGPWVLAVSYAAPTACAVCGTYCVVRTGSCTGSHWFVYWFVYWFVHWFVYWFVYWFALVRALMCS